MTNNDMTTMAQAVRDFVSAADSPVSADQVRAHINATYPGKWQPSTLTAHMYACSVNRPRAYLHHPSAERFLYRNDNGMFSIYDPLIHGPNVWAPVAEEVEVEGGSGERVEDLIEASISFERDIEDHLIRNLAAIEPGLVFKSRQEVIDVGRVDVLAEDASGRRVVIELKAVAGKDSAVGQIARYLGWYQKLDGKRPRGMLIAPEFAEPIRYAASAIPDLQLVSFKVQFAFTPESL